MNEAQAKRRLSKLVTACSAVCRAQLLRYVETQCLPLSDDPHRYPWDLIKLSLAMWSHSQDRVSAKGQFEAARVASDVLWGDEGASVDS